MFTTLNIKMHCFVVKLIEIKFSIFLNFFDVLSKFFRSFFFSMFCLSILCLFYNFAFLCFVVLCFVIDPYVHMHMCLSVRTGFRCNYILYESYTVQCIRIQLPGKRIHLFDKKKEKVKLDFYRWGLKLQCHAR